MEHLNLAGLSVGLLLDTLPCGVLVLGAEGTVQVLNQPGATWWGLPPAAVQGQPLAALAPAHLPADLYQALRELAAGAPLPPAEFFLPHAQQWITQTSTRQAGRVVVYWQDITARKHTEERQAFLLQLSDALRPLKDPVDIQATAARVLGQHLDVDRAYYVGIDEAAQEFVVARDWHRPGAPSRARRYPLGEWPMPWLADGQTWVAHDVDTDPTLPDEQRAGYRGNDVRAAVVVPLLKQSRLVATLVTNQHTPRAWAPHEVALVEEVAERTWAAVERAQAEEALRASETRHRAELEQQVQQRTAELQQNRDLLQATIDSSLDVIQVFEAVRDEAGHLVDFRWLLNNHTSERLYGEVRGQHLLERNPGVVEEGIFADFQRVVETGKPHQVERYYAHEQFDGWFLQSVVKLGDGVATSTTDITAWKKTQAENIRLREEVAAAKLRESEENYRKLIDFIPAAVYACHADATLAYYNARAVELWGRAPALRDETWRLCGSWRTYLPDGTLLEPGESPMAGVLATGEPVVNRELKIERPDHSTIDILVNITALRDAAGHVVGAVNIFQDITERKRTEEALRQSEEYFRLFVTTSSDTLYRMSPDWRQTLAIVGKNFLADTQNPSTTWVERYIPQAEQARAWATIGAAIAGKVPFELEHRVYRADGAVAWTSSRAVPVLDAQGNIVEWFGAATDITGRKQAEQQLAEFSAQLEQQVAERTQQLQQNRDLLHGIAESQSAYVSAFKAIRDEHGRLVDLEYIFVNAIAEPLDGARSLVGRRYLEVFPEEKNSGFLDAYRRVIETGVREDRELAYPDGPLTGWFRSNATPLGDGVLVIGEDITARKQAEQERFNNLHLLEQAEAVAGLGSWDYELATGTLRWSAGMYALFGWPLGCAVAPAAYLEVVVEADRARAEQVVHRLTTDVGDFEETLRLYVRRAVKTVRIKSVVFRDEQGQAVRVLGVALDITERQRLEADNLHLRLSQQHALFEAVQAAQEAERKTIAEGLHNGIGQILYATKLRLDQLHAPLLGANSALEADRREVDQLLSEAIRQTRVLSHELVPLMLEQFGLASALRDIGRKMSTPQLRFACQVLLDEDAAPLASALQLALYRMAQELAQNIVKHARGATEASLELETMPGWVLLRAEDDGPGFAAPSPADAGLGLRSIRDRVALLGGTIQTGTHLEAGAYVRIRIPLRAT